MCVLPRYQMPESQVAAAVEAALELVNMKEFMHRATHTLSGGQRQRVAIAGVPACPGAHGCRCCSGLQLCWMCLFCA